jgi:dTDP-4-amino-4,6-dideoxygalactose transaminase
VRTEFLVFGSPVIDEDAIAEVAACLRSGWIGTGPRVQRFERMLETYTGAENVRCVSSCTAALHLGMLALGIGRGDEVIVPTMTFVASANAVEHAGATPVFVDCGLIDLDAAERAVGPRTKALMVVHMAGRPVDMDRVEEIRRKHSLLVIEDAAHALGAEWNGRRIGAHGNLTAFSFYVTKNTTTGEGGALATNDAAVAARVETLALHGLSLGAWKRFSDEGFRHYDAGEPGYKYNLTDVQASLGIHQLPKLDGWIQEREELWRRYDTLLEGLPLHRPSVPDPRSRHARHLYQVAVADSSPVSRDEVLDGLLHRRIGSGVHYRAVHLQPFYRDRYRLEADQFPSATWMSERTLSLPLSPKVSTDDQDDVASALGEILAGSPASSPMPAS